MSALNFQPSLAFVWQADFDSPDQGYHVTPGDAGGGTYGGVIESTWRGAVERGLVSGELRDAPRSALATVLQHEFWGPACNALPAGLDLLLFNGRMMTGDFCRIFQSCVGLIGRNVDGDIGPVTMARVRALDARTLIESVSGMHDAYLRELPSWNLFGNGWSNRLYGARNAALSLALSARLMAGLAPAGSVPAGTA